MTANASAQPEPLIEVTDLSVTLPTGQKQFVRAVKSVSLKVYPGERVGIVGESGSGKSVTVRAISGLLPESPLVEVGGSIKFRGKELVGAPARDWHPECEGLTDQEDRPLPNG